MPLQHAVLALLAEGPSYGYDIRGRFGDAVGPQWGLNIGHLYQVLERLHRDQLVEAEVVAQTNRPDRTMYHITPTGQAELDSWLAAPSRRSRGYRDDFILKIMAAARRGTEQLTVLLRTQRQQYLQELRSLADLVTDDAVTRLLVDAAVLHTKADLNLIDLAEQRAEQLLAHARRSMQAPQPDAETEPERRSRRSATNP